MLTSKSGGTRTSTLMQDYGALIGEASLRQRARSAEHTARIEAELANRVKQEFISNMSHELRTPLNTVIGFSRLLSEQEQRKLADAQVAEYAALVRDAAEHLLSIINDILDISKIQSGRYTLDAREIHLDELIPFCVSGFEAAAHDANLTLRTSIDPATPAVKGDPAKLRQVFCNLLGNAIKFTLPGGQISIAVRPSASAGASITVRDSGIGMTEDELTTAMRPFGQVDGTRTRWREGAGLGLPIARALVNLHGGTLSVKSRKGVGTEVAITLPCPQTVSAVARDETPPVIAG